MDILTTRKEAKLLLSDTFPGLKKNYQNCFCCRGSAPDPTGEPRTPLGELTALADPVVAFKGRFAARRGKGREKGRGRKEKEGREGEGPQKSALDLPARGKLLHRF